VISTEFDTSRNIILTKIGGDITVEELIKGYNVMLEHEHFKPDMHAIWDLSGLDLKRRSITEVRQLPALMRQYMERRGKFRAALVTSRASDFLLLKVYLNILKLIGANIHYKLCRNLDEAYAWVEGGKNG
jgi:hypothetical protein